MPTNELDQVISLDVDSRGPGLLDLVEDQWFERKSSRVAPRDLARALVAFANAEGGTIVVGLSEGRVEGIRDRPRHINDLRQAPLDLTSPPVRAHIDQVTVRSSSGTLDAVLVIRVTPGEVMHETTSGECYLRVGDESRKLAFAQRQELSYDRGTAPYDGRTLPGASSDDLDPAALAVYRTASGTSGTTARLLRARSLTVDDSPTVAALLLFGKDPQAWLPHATVRVLKYRERERGTGSRMTLDDDADRRVDGTVVQQISDAADLIEEWIPHRRALSATGRFTPVPIVPRDAWLEGLVNAVVHRSYSNAGDHIRVEIFPDRVEIQSPGRFPGLVDPDRPLEIDRYARNPRIARVCADLRIGQELGEGIRRIYDEMREQGLSDPLYVQTQSSVRLVLSATSRIPEAVSAALPRGATELLPVLRRAARPLGTGEVVELSGQSRPTVLRQLRALREHGLVSWDGKSEKDPRAVWGMSDG